MSRWILKSGDAALILAKDDDGRLLQTWFGAALPRDEDYPVPLEIRKAQWYSKAQIKPYLINTGEANSPDMATLVVRRDSVSGPAYLRFESAEEKAGALTIRLHDKTMGIRLKLRIAPTRTPGLFEAESELENTAADPLIVERFLSLSLMLPQGKPQAVTHFSGHWDDELRENREPIPLGKLVRDNRALSTGHAGTPFIAADSCDPNGASETNGEVRFAMLHWSGNWQAVAEGPRRSEPHVQLQAADKRSAVNLAPSENLSAQKFHLGMADLSPPITLKSGERMSAPRVAFGYTDAGWSGMSQALHTEHRSRIAPRAGFLPPVVYNSWYATEFDVSVSQQVALAKVAAGLGVECFVLDDGWFKGRVNDSAGLGDWTPDPCKFPNGLGELSDACAELGMKFGVWIEPEMVNPDSDLYRAHPDWVLHHPQRERAEIRDQLILNMARKDVQDHLISVISTVVTDAKAGFVKWDMNRNATDVGWPDGADADLPMGQVQGVWRVWHMLREMHPDIIWENCSGGGGRLDWGMMALTEQTWASDNVSAPGRLRIQESYCRLFPPETMASWVCDDPTGRHSLALRFHTAMAGALGVGGDLTTWSDEDLKEATGYIAEYVMLRPMLATSRTIRLKDAADPDVIAHFAIAQDGCSAALFAARLSDGRTPKPVTLFPSGLDPNKVYMLSRTGEVRSGAAWQRRGISLEIKPFHCTLEYFNLVP